MPHARSLLVWLCILMGGSWQLPGPGEAHAPWERTAEARSQEAADESEFEFRLSGESELRLSGTATVGSWRSVSDRIGGTFDPGMELAQIQALIAQLEEAVARGRERDEIEPELGTVTSPTVTLKVPVASLRSGRRAMERDMREALRAEAHPHVTYALERIVKADWFHDEEADALSFELTTRGELSLAGVQRPIEMNVRIEPIADKRFRVIGRRAFHMSDFNIEPPTALFGLIRADERVKVVFDLMVEVAPASGEEASDDAEGE